MKMPLDQCRWADIDALIWDLSGDLQISFSTAMAIAVMIGLTDIPGPPATYEPG